MIYLAASLFGIYGLTLLGVRLFDPVAQVLIFVTVAAIVYTMAFLLKKLLDRRTVGILSNRTMQFLLVSAGLVLVFIYKSFAIDGGYINLGNRAVDFGDIAFVLFFASGVVMFVIITRYIAKENLMRTGNVNCAGIEKIYPRLRRILHGTAYHKARLCKHFNIVQAIHRQ